MNIPLDLLLWIAYSVGTMTWIRTLGTEHKAQQISQQHKTNNEKIIILLLIIGIT